MAATAFEALKARLWGFMQAEIYPNEQLFAAQSKACCCLARAIHAPPDSESACRQPLQYHIITIPDAHYHARPHPAVHAPP